MPDNNWLFFRVFVNMGLLRVGANPDPDAMESALRRLEEFYEGEGWYRDGPRGLMDYDNAFAFHFYGLVYAALAGASDPVRACAFRDRAAAFAGDFIHWFGVAGEALPFGRSLTYRFAQGAFWGALAFAGVEMHPWPVIKSLFMRHLRWWARQPIFTGDGILTVGYAYPNLHMAEQYNSPGSPYWAFKCFLPLALPDTHPFWQAEEAPLPHLPGVRAQKPGTMVVCRDRESRHVFALHGGQTASWMNHGEAKYAKFAYSTLFAFSVPAGQRDLAMGAYDSMLAVSDDGRHFRVRDRIGAARIEEDVVYAQWSPLAGVDVETWLVPFPPWHVRIHRLSTDRRILSAEGGFAAPRPEEDRFAEARRIRKGKGFTLAIYPRAWSGLCDLSAEGAAVRTGWLVMSHPNTNLLYGRTTIPTLLCEHKPGRYLLVCAVAGGCGGENADGVWRHPPDLRREGDVLVLTFEDAMRRVVLPSRREFL